MYNTPAQVKHEDINCEAQLEQYKNLIDLQSAKTLAKRAAQGKKDLSRLDEWRLKSLPETLQQRLTNKKVVYLTKPELCQLMEWKLLRGTWRPKLQQLIESNEESVIEKVTKQAYTSIKPFLNTKNNLDDEKKFNQAFDCVQSALPILCQLSGVGPATASLILSTFPSTTDSNKEGSKVPFLSDEAWYWVFGAEKKVEYTPRGYAKFVRAMIDVSKRTGCSAGNIERYGWCTLRKVKLNRSKATKITEKPIYLDKSTKDIVISKKRSSIQAEKMEDDYNVH
ncbi:hypothetical protein NADFUDRAFT_42195 [Nadsonia fulvescens var. elongata DSM 6958]|uniref:Uncharacterized protein n=1 Tax=Nadsonia fulvescens var. elongata DSM 6958 TaxID=857566 RepID=A0A1E3PHP1_9ASCO|nr:hypothetical protein NADFUDRAFT_42195 [Nadsonia fulvescens var. elongata DSM 6958]